MKPNFALSLSVEGVRLLLRAAGGWRLVGEVMPGDPGLAGELAVLRKTATALAPDGLRCKLVIPNEQIRYLSIDTPGMDTLARRDAARAALDGATPYPVDELAFDISEDGDRTHIAAVAYETLDEAEAFAEEHRFHPVSFVAIPGDNTYLGEPFFGPSKAARTLLGPGQSVEPDGVAIVMIGEAERPDISLAERDAGIPKAPVAIAETQPAPTVKTAPADDASERDRLGDALASFRRSEQPIPEIADPEVPPRDVISQTAAFSSRRKPRRAASETTFPQAAAPEPVQGFAEPAVPTLVAPKPRSVRVPPVSVPRPSKGPKVDAERLTVFGAREAKTRQGAPWYVAFALTVALLVVLAGIAAWASGFVQDGLAGFFDSKGKASIETQAVQVSPPLLEPAPPGDDSPELASLDPNLSDEDAAVLDALRTPLIDDDTEAASIATDEDHRASYAVTGIWPHAPEVPQPPALVDIEDLYVTSIDPIEPAFDAVALPPASGFEGDITLEDPGTPAAAGTVFALDQRGLVTASPEGTISPDGIKIFAGAPPARPATFPQRDTPAALLSPVQTELAAFRPRPRPGDLKETTERATLDGLTRLELAQYRPPVRPVSAVETATAAAAASLVPLEDASAAPAAQETPTVQASDSRLALAASLRPGARPSNFNQIVARAQKTAASAASVGAASIAPRTVTPKIPTSASVAREATVRNAINLRKVNLIGVYGTPSDRRALVRLSNGRYKKVQVGDRIDGGRISAIGDSELRYQKSGRNLVLKMPKG
ncbi:hypothetical protein KX928_08325 [Roseobacter sp. YSTF-M11]|uniref:Type IV pilus biogenesis n=1 Tax=Roseobacter insulae TaxID=2859783 RepID=A0A9X1JY35_9RHOB|nr:hypothetical protein [Roseobacter insulae]MBW4707790.1 hypothetical protein [Roseobacter insulae]